jgi:galactose mutarotase-like enzyme
LDVPISQYSLRFSQDDELIVERLESGLIASRDDIVLDNHLLPLSEELFEKDAMILRSLKTSRIELFHLEELVFVLDRGNFPHLGIWKQPNAPFLCIEPWHGFADIANATGILVEKEGIFALEPYESRDFSWFIQL